MVKKYYPTGIPKDLLTDVWFFNPESNCPWHPAPFPPELPKRIILLFSYPGDTVLDPFAGSFTTGLVARELGRNSINMELSDEYIEKGKKKLGFYTRSLMGDTTYEER